MAEISEGFTCTGKRSSRDIETLSGVEAPSAKRTCLGSPPTSAHLTLLEELCDLEGDVADSSLQPVAATEASAAQEDLVAEMMKSLEKVIEEGESRRTGEVSTSRPSSEASSPVHEASTFGLPWTSDGCAVPDYDASFDGELNYGEDFNADARIRHLLQASDDELGIPVSSSSSDLEDSSFHEEWASLSDETGSAGAALNLNWLDSSFQQLEEARDLYEPVILF